jgi:acyl-CoA synthetase (AMP-forming)/AMP-acid ligase II
VTVRTPQRVLEEFAATQEAVEREALPRNLGALLDHAEMHHSARPLWVSVDDGTSLTYGQFADRTRRCAAALASFGVEQGRHVAVMLPSVPAFAITWMALAKLGAVMIPVNTRFTGRELDDALKESDAEFLVIDRDYLDVLRQIDGPAAPVPRTRTIVHGEPVSGYPNTWQAMVSAASPAGTPSRDVDLDQVASIQFTSGSTSFPKGCMLSHRYWLVIGSVRWRQGPPVSRLLVDLPFHYMGGQWRVLMAMYTGATVFVARQASVNRLLDRLIDFEIDFCTVTSALAKVPDDPRHGETALRWVVSAGLNKDFHRDLERRLGAPIREVYGLTEVGSTLTVPIGAVETVGSGTCGVPVAFRKCSIVDREGREVPVGQSGELWISGPAMMQGYYKRPDATAQAMHGEWFRSGDLFRRDRDGYHFLLGRIKDVIRRSGENISASDIETTLQGMAEILEVAAVAVPDPTRGEEVKIYVSLRPGYRLEDVPPGRIMAFSQERLARFKLPRYIEYLDSLPKTASGKISKQDLRGAKKDLRDSSFDVIENRWR